MTEPRTFEELRAVMHDRHRSPHSFLFDGEEAVHNSEAAYVVTRQTDGSHRVTVRERGEVLYDETFADEHSTVRALDGLLGPQPVGRPATTDELEESRRASLVLRQEILRRARERAGRGEV